MVNTYTPHKHRETIRNVSAFVAAYINGEHGKSTVNRPVRYREETAPNSKGKPVVHKIALGYATLAHAFVAAVC